MHWIVQFIGMITLGLCLIGCRPSANGPDPGETPEITAEWVSHETGLKPFVQNMTGFVMGRRQTNTGDFWFEYRTPSSAKDFFANLEAATAVAGWKKIYEAESVRHFIIRNTTTDPAGKTLPYRSAATLNSYLIISAVYNRYYDAGTVTIKGQFVHLK